MRSVSLSWSRYSVASSLSTSVISVPRPSVLPRGSGKISKSLASAVELNTCCWLDLAATEAT
jgi:hypothetical protein